MSTGRNFSGKKLSLTIAFGVLVAAAFGAGCKGFFQAPTLTSITINPNNPSVQLGQSITLSAYGVNNNGQGSYLTSGVSWSSSDDSVATVTGTGSATLTGITIGSATITASAESVTNSQTATVYITISSMTISPSSQSLATNTSYTPLPYVVTANGNENISPTATLTAYLNGTASTDITCTYYTSSPTGGSGGAGQYCSDDGSATAGSYQIVATYTGTTLTATATLSVPAPSVAASMKKTDIARK